MRPMTSAEIDAMFDVHGRAQGEAAERSMSVRHVVETAMPDHAGLDGVKPLEPIQAASPRPNPYGATATTPNIVRLIEN